MTRSRWRWACSLALWLGLASLAFAKEKELDYYQLLGVPRNASSEEIRRAHREKSLANHPDRDSADFDRRNELQSRLNEARTVLLSPRKRWLYNQTHPADLGGAASKAGAPASGASGAVAPPGPGAPLAEAVSFLQQPVDLVKRSLEEGWKRLQVEHRARLPYYGKYLKAQYDLLRKHLVRKEQVPVALDILQTQLSHGSPLSTAWIEPFCAIQDPAKLELLRKLSKVFTAYNEGSRLEEERLGRWAERIRSLPEGTSLAPTQGAVDRLARQATEARLRRDLKGVDRLLGSAEKELSAQAAARPGTFAARALALIRQSASPKAPAYARFEVSGKDSLRDSFVERVPEVRTEAQLRYFELIARHASQGLKADLVQASLLNLSQVTAATRLDSFDRWLSDARAGRAQDPGSAVAPTAASSRGCMLESYEATAQLAP